MFRLLVANFILSVVWGFEFPRISQAANLAGKAIICEAFPEKVKEWGYNTQTGEHIKLWRFQGGYAFFFYVDQSHPLQLLAGDKYKYEISANSIRWAELRNELIWELDLNNLILYQFKQKFYQCELTAPKKINAGLKSYILH